MTADTRDAPVTARSFAAVAAETADWLAERVMVFEVCGISRPGGAERLRQQALSYRVAPGLLAAAVR